jgi:hypothetical protein
MTFVEQCSQNEAQLQRLEWTAATFLQQRSELCLQLPFDALLHLQALSIQHWNPQQSRSQMEIPSCSTEVKNLNCQKNEKMRDLEANLL